MANHDNNNEIKDADPEPDSSEALAESTSSFESPWESSVFCTHSSVPAVARLI